jgi:carbonic anhydrase
MVAQIILAVVILAVVVVVANYYSKKRAEALQKAAIQMGFTYEREGLPFFKELDANLHLLRLGRGKKLYNLMRGPQGAVIFDYQYIRGGFVDNTRRASTQTVAAFPCPASALPAFSLGPEHLWQKVASALGYQLIKVDTHPVFCKRFALRGADETAIRQLFAPPLVEYCQSWPDQPAWCMDGAGQWLLLYHPDRSVKPLDLRAFADGTASMFKEITTRAGIAL